MTLGVLVAMAWFLVVAAMLVWQFVSGAFARGEGARENAPVRLLEPETPACEPAFALATRYKKAKAPLCTRRRATAA